MMPSMWRSRWAAVGAAVAITLGAGGLNSTNAMTSSGERPIYKPINPCRLVDIRPAPNTVGPRTSPLGPDEAYTQSGWGVVGNCNLPTGTAGLALNVTAVAPSQVTYLTIYPADASPPLTSNLNPAPGQPPTPNAVNVDLSATGQFNIFNKFGNVYVIVDVVGYFDDHNHDDVYYTEAEVNAALQAVRDSMPFALHADSTNVPLLTEPSQTNVVQVTVTAKVAGRVSLNASASPQIDPATEGADVYCEILPSTAPTTGALWDGPGSAFFEKTGASDSGTISPTMQYPIGAGQTVTYQLRCQEEEEPLAASSYLWNASLNAIFTPTG